MSKTLPKWLYARVEQNGSESYIVAEPKPQEIVDGDGPTVIGVYQLVEKQTLAKRIYQAKPARKVR